jgi:hypothetical protein
VLAHQPPVDINSILWPGAVLLPGADVHSPSDYGNDEESRSNDRTLIVGGPVSVPLGILLALPAEQGALSRLRVTIPEAGS